MSTVKSIFLWGIGAIYIVYAFAVSIVLSFLLPPEKVDKKIKRLCQKLFRVMRIRVSVEGQEKIDPRNTYLFMSNHVSLFDIPILEGFIPTYVRGIEAKRQFRWPVYGWLIRRLGNIPIERGNVSSSIRSMRIAADRLKNGHSLVVLPEGHRTLDGKMRPFKRLPFFMAKEAGIPIVPVGLSGLFQLKSKRSWKIRPTPIKVRFGGIIDPATIANSSATELRNLTRSRIAALIETP